MEHGHILKFPQLRPHHQMGRRAQPSNNVFRRVLYTLVRVLLDIAELKLAACTTAHHQGATTTSWPHFLISRHSSPAAGGFSLSLLCKNDGVVNTFWIFLCSYCSICLIPRRPPLLIVKKAVPTPSCVCRVSLHMTPRRRSRSVRARTGVLSPRLGTRQELAAVKNKFSTSTTSDIITSHVIRRDDASPECCVSTCEIKKKTKKTSRRWSPWFHFCPSALKQQRRESRTWWILASLLPFCRGTRAAHLTSPHLEK